MRISDWSSDVCSSDLQARKQLGNQQRRHAIGARAFGGAEHQRQQREFIADGRDRQRREDQPPPALTKFDGYRSTCLLPRVSCTGSKLLLIGPSIKIQRASGREEGGRTGESVAGAG